MLAYICKRKHIKLWTSVRRNNDNTTMTTYVGPGLNRSRYRLGLVEFCY